ncbi:hypothetical protein GUITHDRAFT_114591 [Guillardia theta CCMP2712]|uniref:Thioredoxin domain-containing protein n=1 Tax=Guillardia theta (strain CCMP2712) TaxID=905079 RepID=L1IT41_GUITC|nr:hypothetical protein GUITHDRAFT_114591 [Guillardia theta CCMP2712]EKX39393.1 hypothetical protein GUITHDRAFT_114591 [Guillardia theta CCMP2712]|eukprot:XP_005826373.1 hypothetical protein GUITHDRAFT_114591 [Guillardia theta CCMP2712]
MDVSMGFSDGFVEGGREGVKEFRTVRKRKKGHRKKKGKNLYGGMFYYNGVDAFLSQVRGATLNQRHAPNMAAIALRAAGCRLQSAQAVAASEAHRMKISCGMSRAASMTVMKRSMSTESSPSNVVDVTVQNFQTVFAEKVTFVIACYMPGDQISTAVVSRLESAIKSYPSLKLARVDVEANRELIDAFRLEVVPTVLVFSNQRVSDKISSDTRTESKMYSKGEFVGALEVYKDVLQQEEEGSENGAMCVAGECGLAMCALALEDPSGAASLVEQLNDKYSAWLENRMVKQAVTGVNMSIEARKMGGSVEEFQALVANNPDDMEAREKLAGQSTSMTKIVTDIPLVLLFSHQDYAEAIEHALHIFKKDKNKSEGNGRKLLFKFFDTLGHAHPDVIEGRKRMSALLFI